MILTKMSETAFSHLSLRNLTTPIETQSARSAIQSPRETAVFDISVHLYLAGLTFSPSYFAHASLPKANIDERLQHLSAFFDNIHLSAENEHVFFVEIARPRHFDRENALREYLPHNTLHALFAESYAYWCSSHSDLDDRSFASGEKVYFSAKSIENISPHSFEDPLLKFVQEFRGKDIIFLPVYLPMHTLESNQLLESYCRAGYRLIFVGAPSKSNGSCVIRWVGFDRYQG